ncbi:GNAT family N-acetyltransferase [Candidatus Bathyarchaeota archaeon]|nr:GNAT family N-acetyltransferase [Candidatus Bathyarchaeota archaeon]
MNYLVKQVNPFNDEEILQETKELYLSSFSIELLETWDDLLRLLKKYHPYSSDKPDLHKKMGMLCALKDGHDNNTITGFLIFTVDTSNNWIFLDYLAVKPEMMGMGIGTFLIKQAYPFAYKWSGLKGATFEFKALLGEIEPINPHVPYEASIINRRRRKFFHRLGFKKLDVKYFQPDIGIKDSPVQLDLIIKPITWLPPYTPGEIRRFIKEIYKVIYELDEAGVNALLPAMNGIDNNREIHVLPLHSPESP